MLYRFHHHLTSTIVRTKINLYYTCKNGSHSAVNTPNMGYKNQAADVEGNNSCLFNYPHSTGKCTQQPPYFKMSYVYYREIILIRIVA